MDNIMYFRENMIQKVENGGLVDRLNGRYLRNWIQRWPGFSEGNRSSGPV